MGCLDAANLMNVREISRNLGTFLRRKSGLGEPEAAVPSVSTLFSRNILEIQAGRLAFSNENLGAAKTNL